MCACIQGPPAAASMCETIPISTGHRPVATEMKRQKSAREIFAGAFEFLPENNGTVMALLLS